MNEQTSSSGNGRRGSTEHVETVIIGAGQSGLSVGHYLASHGRDFVLLEAAERIGDQWRQRWDSLRLFTPARYDGLAGLRFPADPTYFPTKDEMADYLETYAAHFELPVRTRTRVRRLSRSGTRFTVGTDSGDIEADNVVVAMASYQRPCVLDFAAELDDRIVQLHSFDYRNPGQLQDGDVLLVGAGNSAAEIAMEVSRTHATWVSGRNVGHIPFRIDGFLGRHLLLRAVLRGLFHRVLTVDTPIGRKVRPKVLTRGGPLIRTKPKNLAAAGVQRIPRVAGVQDGRPVLDDGRVLDVANVIWCVGFDPGFDWIDLPVHGDHEPLHDRGIVPTVPGLYFTGLHFLNSLSSGMIHGAARDARRIADHIVERTPATTGRALGDTVADWLPDPAGSQRDGADSDRVSAPRAAPAAAPAPPRPRAAAPQRPSASIRPGDVVDQQHRPRWHLAGDFQPGQRRRGLVQRVAHVLLVGLTDVGAHQGTVHGQPAERAEAVGHRVDGS